MKLNLSRSSKRGIAMTEYLVILAIVAIASIVVVRGYGKQVKTVLTNSLDAMGGRPASAAVVDTVTVADSHAGNFSTGAGN
jgi:Flp pilus assembly pilin Flp